MCRWEIHYAYIPFGKTPFSIKMREPAKLDLNEVRGCVVFLVDFRFILQLKTNF